MWELQCVYKRGGGGFGWGIGADDGANRAEQQLIHYEDLDATSGVKCYFVAVWSFASGTRGLNSPLRHDELCKSNLILMHISLNYSLLFIMKNIFTTMIKKLFICCLRIYFLRLQ